MNYRLLKTIGFGVGSALIAMAVLPVLARAAKPIVKSIIKGGLNLKDQIKDACSEDKKEN